MTLFSPHASPLEEVWVALDLETTGLSPEEDRIIEVGAVKFQGDKVLDTFETLVNPGRKLGGFVKGLTGISQGEVDSAPAFSAVAAGLASFIGPVPIIGHNLPFDLGFLASHGLRLSNPRCDTWDLAYVLRPSLSTYALSNLAERLDVSHDRPHRALSDATATMELFLRLVEDASGLDPNIVAEMRRLASRSSWVLGHVLGSIEAAGRSQPQDGAEPQSSVTGLDARELARRLNHGRALRPNSETERLDVEFVASLISEGGPLADAIEGYEERPEQVQMARAVTEAINEGQRLIVEAGTGVGKSLAYLLPAALHALVNGRRVIVSTSTINLQEQLVNKDLPDLVRALSTVEGVPADDLRYTQLKGRANYLCLRRWANARTDDSPSEADARMLSKLLVWLQSTRTGDRAELNLGGRSAATPWERLSAQRATDCLGSGGPCFVRAARDRAAASHIVIINHALLLSDLSAGGTLLPDHDVLIIDEAHHLEDEATRHLGFDLAQAGVDDHLNALTGERGLLSEAVAAFRTSTAAQSRRETVEGVTAQIGETIPAVRDHVAMLFAMLAGLFDGDGDGGRGGFGRGWEMRVTSGTRSQPAWSELEAQWERVDVSLKEAGRGLTRLTVALEGLEEAELLRYDSLLMNVSVLQQANAELVMRLTEFVPHPEPGSVYWITSPPRGGDLTLRGAPLHVGEALEERLFSTRDSIVVTSATLSTDGTFDHVRERTGFTEAEELLLGSPFDYGKAALMCVPDDMPEPNSPDYQTAVQRAVADAALAAEGRTMALFTSHAALQATANGIRQGLAAKGINVLAQGVDGSPRRLLDRFLDEPESVLLGTASFWEGVDLAGDALRVLLVARLPFSVPSEPVFAARSEHYDDSFNQYAVPQAVLRLRQGFGRLIRTKTDRGVAVILDRRLTSRRYGKAFMRSLPECTFRPCSLGGLSEEVRGWLRLR